MEAESLLRSESLASCTFPRRQRSGKVDGSLVQWIHRVGASGSAMGKSRYSRLRSKRGSTFTIILALLFTLTMPLLLMMIHLGFVSPNELAFFRRKASQRKGKQWVQVLSSSEPRAFLYHNFLSKEECEYLIALCKPHMRKSMVIDTRTGQVEESRERTSTEMSLQRGGDTIVKAIERRIAEFTFVPIEHGESIHVLHYAVGQKSEPHFDYAHTNYSFQRGGQRIATVVMYLSDVEEGGETVFLAPRGKYIGWNESECGREGLAVKPKMGNALLFWNINPDATPDPSSLHSSCPVIKGNKWSATKWIHEIRFGS